MNTVLFTQKLIELFNDATLRGENKIAVQSGDLHRLVGSYPGNDHRMPICCNVMRSQMNRSDVIISQPPEGDGASLVIEYNLPR